MADRAKFMFDFYMLFFFSASEVKTRKDSESILLVEKLSTPNLGADSEYEAGDENGSGKSVHEKTFPCTCVFAKLLRH